MKTQNTAMLVAGGGISSVFVLVLSLVILGGGANDLQPPGLKRDAVPAQYQQWVLRAGNMCPNTVGPAAIAAQIEAESHWNPNATSSAMAQGIAQFMPSTWPSWGQDVDGNRDGPWSDRDLGSPLDPFDAIVAQGRFMCSLADTVRGYVGAGKAQGDILDLALAAYNAGPGGVLSANGVPHNGETELYVTKIRSLMAKYSQIEGPPANAEFGDGVVRAATSQLRKPYVWGGGDFNGPTGGGFDCSGLVMYALYQASQGKVALSKHLADWQATQGQAVTEPSIGSQINLELLRRGDVIAFAETGAAKYHHIGIYMGQGQMVHAPTFGETVEETELNTDYWRTQTWSVRRFG